MNAPMLFHGNEPNFHMIKTGADFGAAVVPYPTEVYSSRTRTDSYMTP